MKYLSLICIVLLMTGCADEVTLSQAQSIDPVGFWYGLWHGVIFPIAWIASLFMDSAIYATYNNGGWYDFGFMIGVCFLGVGASGSSSD